MPGLNINWREPTTELEHNFLSMLLWRDMWSNRYGVKEHSRYYYLSNTHKSNCPNCSFYISKKIDEDNCSYFECGKNCCLIIPTTDIGYLPCDYYFKFSNKIILDWEDPNQYAYMIYRRLQNKVLELIGEYNKYKEHNEDIANIILGTRKGGK